MSESFLIRTRWKKPLRALWKAKKNLTCFFVVFIFATFWKMICSGSNILIPPQLWLMSLHCSTWRAVDLCYYLQNAGGNPRAILHCVAEDLHPDQTFLMVFLFYPVLQCPLAWKLYQGDNSEGQQETLKLVRKFPNYCESYFVGISHSPALCACSAHYLGWRSVRMST